jgi:hypothetical protein
MVLVFVLAVGRGASGLSVVVLSYIQYNHGCTLVPESLAIHQTTCPGSGHRQPCVIFDLGGNSL